MSSNYEPSKIAVSLFQSYTQFVRETGLANAEDINKQALRFIYTTISNEVLVIEQRDIEYITKLNKLELFNVGENNIRDFNEAVKVLDNSNIDKGLLSFISQRLIVFIYRAHDEREVDAKTRLKLASVSYLLLKLNNAVDYPQTRLGLDTVLGFNSLLGIDRIALSQSILESLILKSFDNSMYAPTEQIANYFIVS